MRPGNAMTAASCAALTPAQEFAAATVVFDGVMTSGPTAPRSGGVLATPAHVRVERYLKGAGPRMTTVTTAMRLAGHVTLVSEDGIRPHAGEQWRIYATSHHPPFSTSTCIGSHPLPTPTKRFATQGISFRYPATWRARTFVMPPMTFQQSLVWLSRQRLKPPCRTHHGTHNTTVSCSLPIHRLDRDSILAEWTSNAAPGGPPRVPGWTRVAVDGRHGWLLQKPADPGRVTVQGQDVIVTVIVPIPASQDGWYEFDAELRGPDTATAARQIRTMLHSVRWR